MAIAHRVIISEIVEQHVEEAAFLWSQRDAATTAPHYSLQDLADLDERVEAHLDGIRVAGDSGWKLCAEAIDADDSGSVFAASVIAFESGNGHWIDQAVEEGASSLTAFRGMLSGLSWISDEHFRSLLPSLLQANSQHYKRLAIAACAARREDPGVELENALKSEDLFLRVRALKATGKLKRSDLLPLVKESLHHKIHACRFAAAQTALLLGDHSALDIMGAFVHSKTAFRIPAMQIALRILDIQTALMWLRPMAKHPDHMRDVLIGTGITGDPAYIHSLIKQMENPELARVAGESFSMITGVDLALEDMEGEWPDRFETGPNDNPEDDNVEMDADEDLPWPDVKLINRWWEQNHGSFGASIRYLGGAPITPEHCIHILKTGTQRQRSAAALELALSDVNRSFFNTRAKGCLQESQL